MVKENKWVPLHLHSIFSNFDGTIPVEGLVEWAEKLEVPAVAITDHGIMSAVPLFASTTNSSSVKPLFGCELYADAFSFPEERDKVLEKMDGSVKDDLRPSYHLVAIAKNFTGYHNLIKMLSCAHRDNFYRKARVTRDMLEEYSDGIAFSSACVSGELPSLLREGKIDQAIRYSEMMRSLTKGNFRVELMDTGDLDARQLKLNKILHDFALDRGFEEIMTCDAHYFSEDRKWHPHILAINKGMTLEEMKNKQSVSATEYDEADLSVFDLSLRTPSEMWERWGDVYPEALLNTTRLSDTIERYSIVPDKYYMPSFDKGSTRPLKELARDGLTEKFFQNAIRDKGTYQDRLEYELELVEKMGFNDYFLMVHEMVDWARSVGIFVGPGRGSAAGSILSWSLGITSVDPIRHGLFFERFLNPERVSMPDIDVDFEDTRRGEVIEHLVEKYGKQSVSGIIGYSEAKWKRSLRDAAKTLGYGAGENEIGGVFASAVSSFIDSEGLDGAIGKNPEIPERIVEEGMRTSSLLKKQKNEITEIANLGQKFLSLVRHYTKHASGIVIAPPDVTDHCPLYNLKGAGDMVVQYDMNGVESIKLVKMDILGLSNLSIMKDTWQKARLFDSSTPSPEILYAFLDNSDENMFETSLDKFAGQISKESIEKTLEMLGRGDTTGVFQLLSAGMRKLLMGMKPRNIEDLSALIALYRPGPLASGMTKSYLEISAAKNKNPFFQRKPLEENNEGVFPESVEKLIYKITKETSGMAIYQEQVMGIARSLCGYSLGEADNLRRAMGKKKLEAMHKEKEKFVKRCIEHSGLSEEDASVTFDKLEHFAGYGFNKSHSAAYSYLAFATAWYKANREPVFWTSFLKVKATQEKKENMAAYIREFSRNWELNSPVLLPEDKGLEDSLDCRTLRDGRKIGTLFPEFNDIEKVNSVLWSLPDNWQSFMGLSMMNGITPDKISLISKVQNQGNLIDLIRFLVFHQDGRDMNPNIIAQLILGGVFDSFLEKLSDGFGKNFHSLDPRMTDHHKEVSKKQLEQKTVSLNEQMLFNDLELKVEADVEDNLLPEIENSLEKTDNKIKEDFSVQVLRSVLIRMEEFMEKDAVLRDKVKDVFMNLIQRAETETEKRLLTVNRDRFTAFFSLCIQRIRAKTLLKRNPWGIKEVEEILQRVFLALEHMIDISLSLENHLMSDYQIRFRTIQSMYQEESMEFGEGLRFSSWLLAAEATGWSINGFIDELDVFTALMRNESFNKNTLWGKGALDYGLWFLGYFENMLFKWGKQSIIMSGRWGNNLKNQFIEVEEKNPDIFKAVKNSLYAVRLKFDFSKWFGRGAWVLQEIKQIPLIESFSKLNTAMTTGVFSPFYLKGKSGNSIIRVRNDYDKETFEKMKKYLVDTYKHFSNTDAKGVVLALTPREISCEKDIVFQTVYFNDEQACDSKENEKENEQQLDKILFSEPHI